ncbi:MAG: hypothetical protein FWH48_10735 [Oscillospiraceae bacterium]|nr:hypothetical protein [Oscillospiraceae bacterium]
MKIKMIFLYVAVSLLLASCSFKTENSIAISLPIGDDKISLVLIDPQGEIGIDDYDDTTNYIIPFSKSGKVVFDRDIDIFVLCDELVIGLLFAEVGERYNAEDDLGLGKPGSMASFKIENSSFWFVSEEMWDKVKSTYKVKKLKEYDFFNLEGIFK